MEPFARPASGSESAAYAPRTITVPPKRAVNASSAAFSARRRDSLAENNVSCVDG